MTRQRGGDVLLSPIIDPDDYDNDTDYLNAIPGMAEKLIEGMNTPLSECEDWD
jgi:PHD/YefM family antitoxin component YafN of YafNO toxin-antitoxin module